MSVEYTAVRTESDSLGSIHVPARSYRGPQTERAVRNFGISGISVSRFPGFIRAFAAVKLAAAEANVASGLLDRRIGNAIVVACAKIMNGLHHDEFIVDVFQGGAGTSTNMNFNEVIANLALEEMGHAKGRYDIVSPLDHVNLGQSTNDVYPTAGKLSVHSAIRKLLVEIDALRRAFESLARKSEGIVKVGRTEFQDAVPMFASREVTAFADALVSVEPSLHFCLDELESVSLGGTAIGSGLNSSQSFRELAVQKLSQLLGVNCRMSTTLYRDSWDGTTFLGVSSCCKRLATILAKIAGDLRFLSSGPRAGIGEIILPAVQPGSSAMPGKVNPVIPELVSQICFQVFGKDAAITFALEAAHLQLNTMGPAVTYNLLSSLELLMHAMNRFRTLCIEGLTYDSNRCAANLDNSLCCVTALVGVLGYDGATSIAKSALADRMSVGEVLKARSMFSEQASLDVSRLALDFDGGEVDG